MTDLYLQAKDVQGSDLLFEFNIKSIQDGKVKNIVNRIWLNDIDAFYDFIESDAFCKFLQKYGVSYYEEK